MVASTKKIFRADYFRLQQTIRKLGKNPFRARRSPGGATPVLTKKVPHPSTPVSRWAPVASPVTSKSDPSQILAPSEDHLARKLFASSTPRVLVRPYMSRGFLEPPITIDDTLDDADEIDLSMCADASTPTSRKRRFSSEETNESKRFKSDDNLNKEFAAVLGRAESTYGNRHWLHSESPEIVIHCESNHVEDFTPRRTVRFKSPASNVLRRLTHRKEAAKKVTLTAPLTPVTAVQPGYNFSPTLRPTNFASGISHVQGDVFEFKAHRNHQLPALGTKQRTRTDLSRKSMGNVYVPSDIDQTSNRRRGSLRPIVIDGSNVAMAHGESRGYPRNRQFSSRGIDICIDYFKRRGHEEVVAIVPHFRVKAGQAVGQETLLRLVRSKSVILTPSRDFPGGRSFQSYDDRYTVQYAAINGGIVVSNDQFRDLLKEGKSIRETIEQRQLMFTWMPDSDILMFPTDPLGRNGPNLDRFLKF